jgi:acyl-CoA reductase-like NAD-dependent aldehyde dehydrogenase
MKESVEFINSRPKPLAIYAFTKDETLKRKILAETSSGSVTFNDVLVQVLHLIPLPKVSFRINLAKGFKYKTLTLFNVYL